MIEYRQAFPVEDIIGIELACSKQNCTGIFTLSVAQNGVEKIQKCPVCGDTWWDQTKSSHPYQILAALVDARRGTWKGTPMDPDRRVEHPPIVRLILPTPQVPRTH